MKKGLRILITLLMTLAVLFGVVGCRQEVSPAPSGSDANAEDDSQGKTPSDDEEVTTGGGEEDAPSAYVYENVSYATLEETTWDRINKKPGLPSTGEVNVLVIPIAFLNTNLKKYGSREEIKDRLEKAFNGDSADTGWHSLRSYYEETSYGQLHLHADILDVYDTGKNYDLYGGESGVDDCEYLLNALDFYDETVDYSAYDQNEDGQIDCVYIVYLAPYAKYDGETDLWWAYCDNYGYYYEAEYFDGKAVGSFLWFSIDFFRDEIAGYYDDDDEYRKVYVDINCETVIHETGHALGLDDYYDFDEEDGVKGGLGYCTMMDANQGDHDPYSKAILGWIHPTVVTGGEYSATLRSFAETGDSIILSKSNGGSYFEEYYAIAFYTPTGANAYKKDLSCGLPEHSGIMVWHIDATLFAEEDLDEAASPFDITLYNNGNASRKLISLVCADGSADIDADPDYLVTDKDLFAASSTIRDLRWYDGTSVNAVLSFGEFTSVDGVEQTTVAIAYDAE